MKLLTEPEAAKHASPLGGAEREELNGLAGLAMYSWPEEPTAEIR